MIADAAVKPDGLAPGYCPTFQVPSANGWVTSPLGTLSATVAVFGLYGGECGGLRITLAKDQAALEDFIDKSTISGPLPGTDVVVLIPMGFEVKTGASGPMNIHQTQSGSKGTGTLQINEYVAPSVMGHPSNAPRLSVSFTVGGSGWSGGGSVDTTYCSGTDILCP